ncbi:MAG: glutathione peroxidase [Steroidobacteraceae bacterium]|jgi:glutathione peroxidase|nr:glutathione peroxidase [Steroidobacteraceae bacterium]
MSTTHTAIPLKTIDGRDTSLDAYRGKVALVVNVASKCGLTPQYAGLEKLYREKSGAGLVVLGFPANDFAGQEPGTEQEIANFCSTQYDVTFPMFAKISVVGANQHPLYRELTRLQPDTAGDPDGFRKALKGYGIEPNPAPQVLWNFEKFLLARDGRVAGRFAPNVAADDPALVAAIDAELAKA